ncbi:hypothetical protein FOXYS1_8685 [Fusarium oxysporum]|uniref:Uncharacterized protein n=1 Tax=Fusarium oxysporum TaxID=5507 RepID=A0A8H5EH87_FUSOX|nr:hypothetical protein FOXYS1_8685 [Fusarium oxysporum]
MPFNVFTTTVIAFLAAPALANPIDTLPAGLESHLESRAADVTARYRQKNCQGCSQKDLNLYDCFNIGDEWKSMKFKC